MVGDPDTEARMETLAHRVEFVELLDHRGPLPPRDIVDALPYSRPTVTRALRELREADLLEQHEKGYAPTLAGTLAAREYRRYEQASQAILSADDLLAPLPEAHALPVDVLLDANTILTRAQVPVRALETVSDRVRQADTVRAYLPTLVNTHLLRVWHRAVVAASLDSEAFFDPDLLTMLKGQYPHLLAEMAATEGFAASSTTGPPYGIILTTADDTTAVAVIVYEDDTALRGVLTNDSPPAVEWARTELDQLRTAATDVTADLDALSTALTDGVSRLSPSTEDGPGRTSNSHPLPIDLETEGFVRLSQEYFDAHNQAAPAVSWRTGFTLAEVKAGHAVDRLDPDGNNLTGRLVGSLQTGTDHVVLGPPGSGKSTVCMAVACEWYDRDLGPVLYRERGDADSFESAALLEAYLRETDDHALVVVEDAIRDEANAILEVMQTLDADPSVTFLLDARTHEWRNPDPFDLDARRDAYRRTSLERLTVPDLDERECQRFAEHFTALVDADLDLSGAELFAMTEKGTAGTQGESLPAGDALVVQHHLVRRSDPTVDLETSAATALDDAVRHTYRTLTDAKARLAPDLAVLVALLTAAGIPVAREYLYAIADDESAAADEAVSLLEGRLLFEQDQPRTRASTYRTRHETWALRFLEGVHDLEPTDRARERFGRCVTRLLALADEPARRERIQRHLGGRTPHLHRIEADPRRWADELAERIFSVGRTDASLAPLFGETAGGAIELPEACSAWTRLRQAYWRGEMNRTHGDLARAEREFRTLGELAEDVDFSGLAAEPVAPDFDREIGDSDATAHRTRWRARSRTNLGTIARDRGQNEAAEEYHREALALFREIDDRKGEAVSLKNLGIVAFYRSDYEGAREYYDRSLDIAVEHGLKRIEADCLNNLAGIAWQQGAHDRAREYLERSLDISHDLGDRQAELSILNNLGEIAQAQGAYEVAREYYERSLAISRDLGHRRGEAATLNNLGLVAKRQSAYKEAREYLEQSLAIKRELGDRQGQARSLNNLGEVDRYQGAYEEAREHLERSLAISRDLDDRQGEAASLDNLGMVAHCRGDYDEADERIQGSLAIARDIGAQSVEAASLNDLGRVAFRQGEYEEAREYLDGALDTFEAVGSDSGVARVLLMTGRLALTQGEVDLARDRAREACETFGELGMSHWEGRSHRLLGRVAAAAGAPEEAREHWRTALEAFEEIGASPDALETLKELIETGREQGEGEQAREWCRRARDVAADAPDPTAAQHRDWIERHAAELEVG